jgi:hypothetical protein
MPNRLRCLCLTLIVLGFVLPAQAQDERGWTFSGRFQGSSSSSGTVLKVDPSLGYVFNKYFQTYAGVPVYFVNASGTTSTSGGFINGIGNAYLGFRLGIENPAVNFASNLVATAPTGDKDKGFSTGQATVDWTNSFSRTFSTVTPFASAGVANTVSDTSFFVRPFSSKGLVGHFDGGAILGLSQFVDVGASAYSVVASGEQRIFSKVVKPELTAGRSGRKRVFESGGETVGSSDIANDHGFSAWFGVSPTSKVNFEIGYSRSVSYDLNSLFFGIGFRLGR